MIPKSTYVKVSISVLQGTATTQSGGGGEIPEVVIETLGELYNNLDIHNILELHT